VGWTPPRAGLCLARGLDAPSRARPHLGRESSTPSSESPSRSRGSQALRLHTCSPGRGIQCTDICRRQVKGESIPLRAWESCPGTAPPTPVAQPSPPLCDAVPRGQQPPRGTVPPTLVRPAHCTLEKGRRNPRRDDARLLHARTGRRRDVRPVGAVTSVAISPVRPSLPPRRHPDHCVTIRDVVEACGDGAPPRQPLCLVRPHVNGTLESSRGRPLNEQPLHHPPRSHSWTRTGHAMTPDRSEIRQDGRLLHGTIRHASTRRQNSSARL
jgi:hypothetical protein